MPVEITSKYTMGGEDLYFQAMDLPSTGLFFSDVDVSSNAIPINTISTHNWEMLDLLPEETKYEKLLSTSPNTFLQTTFGTPPQSILSTSACSKLAESVRLRNHDCMWSGRCNSQESHQKSKLKLAAAAKLQAIAGDVKQITASGPSSPSKVRTIQAGESLLRFKQPMQKGQSSDENNNRPDTPQSLEGEDSTQDITCTTTGSNHLPLLSKDAAKEQEVNKIKEYLTDPAKQYKAYDNSTTLADVINTLENGDFKRDNQYPMSPSEESDCRSSQMVDDDTESEQEMDDEYSLQEDDEGISLKMMPTSHLNASRRALALSSKMLSIRHIEDDDEEEDEEDSDEEDEDDDEEEEEGEDALVSLVQGSKVFVGGNRGNVVGYGDDEEDSGTERSLDGRSATAQDKITMQQQTSMHSDHCYTRCKTRVDTKNLGVDTPSDSEEEIDVVGVGEKNLPTNPSARDRKALQATVRNRFVRASTGIVTAPPTGPNSGATTPGGRNPGYYAAMNNGSSYGGSAKVSQMKKRQQQFSKMDDLYFDEDLTQNSNISLSSSGRKLGGAAMRSSGGSSKAVNRKRTAASAGMGYSKSKHYHDSKKSKYSGSVNGGGGGMKGSSRPMQKGYSSANDYRNPSMTSFTVEKRNLHNDLERQRRIGLKNLFEELKCQIPSLRDKERAPKVSILREAAQLCTDLSREQETLFALRRQRERLLQTARSLKLQLQRSANRNK